ncbi:hypothetical protein [Dyadobacter sp. LHD-138]|uniref:hypothetical protein n=1 Tax=Dyadobacter sp. LHD-138 TaxID=3071413 RepID=UPI0027E1E959|nr:hypothetical protein [Dyadobacter sp. LHD-138]MDQ6482217.1 hypothetical protein [Dyadobacter sp. LHD-138]
MRKIFTHLLLVFICISVIHCKKDVNDPDPKTEKKNDDSVAVVPVDSTIIEEKVESVILDIIESPNTEMEKYSLEDFKSSGSVWPKEIIMSQVEKGLVGQNAYKSLTPLVVGKNGKLIGGKEYNEAIAKKIRLETQIYFTDLETFAKVTHLKSADPKYAKLLPLTPNKGVWVYDSYQKHFVSNLTPPSKSGRVNILGNGDFIKCVKDSAYYSSYVGTIYLNPSKVVNWESNSWPGHSAGSLMRYYGDGKTFTQFANELLVIEAQGKAFQGYSEQDQVIDQSLSHNWIDDEETMFVLVSKLHSDKLMDIGAFWKYQALTNGIIYRIDAEKNQVPLNWSYLVFKETYCSLLIWHGYFYYGDEDIDSDGGFWCTPDDILNDVCNNDDLLNNGSINKEYWHRFFKL